MNILVFSWRDPRHPLAGGAEQVMHEHMKGWVKAGHRVTLFSSGIEKLPVEEGMDGIHIVRQGYQYLGVQLAGFFYYLKNRKKFDFVVDQFHGLPFFTPFYVRCPKLAVIQEVARNVWLLNPLPKPFNWIIGLIGYLMEPLIFLFYKRTLFMTGSKSAKKDVNRMGISLGNILVIPHGIITKKIRLRKKKVNAIIYLGILSKDKGIEDALRCFSLLLKKGKFIFWVVGKPETKKYWQHIRNLTKTLKLTKKVKFWGYVSQQEKFKLLSRASLLLNPSIHEGWGLINIEANSCGTPVVAYKVSGSIDSVRNRKSGLLVNLGNVESMASAVLKLSQDKSFYSTLQKGAYKWSQNFSWDRSRILSLRLVEKVANEL